MLGSIAQVGRGLTEGGQDAGGPEDLAAQRRQEEQPAHTRPVLVLQVALTNRDKEEVVQFLRWGVQGGLGGLEHLEWVEHGDVALGPHLVGKEDPTWNIKYRNFDSLVAEVNFQSHRL